MQHMPYVTLTLPQDCIIPAVRRFVFVWIGSERRGAGATWEAKKGAEALTILMDKSLRGGSTPN